MVDFFYWEAQIFNSLEELDTKTSAIDNAANVKYVWDPINGRLLVAWGGPLDIGGEP